MDEEKEQPTSGTWMRDENVQSYVLFDEQGNLFRAAAYLMEAIVFDPDQDKVPHIELVKKHIAAEKERRAWKKMLDS